MFVPFTDRMRKVMSMANQEAQRFNHEFIGMEHILLGLLKLGSGKTIEIFKHFSVDIRKLCLEVETLVKAGCQGPTKLLQESCLKHLVRIMPLNMLWRSAIP